ncbi:MAG: hypothetical protein NT121_17915 [Chloroflexi bacterium]|nr:hypothetical protein [Chloroflexota bacterium]
MNNISSLQLLTMLRKTGLRRGTVFGGILMAALLAFEVFNYSTTDFALTDLLGTNLTFAGVRWATILSIAFCGIDFAGIARLFTPEKSAADEPAEVWYLFGAWVLAAAMNATLTWWGVAVATNGHTALGSAIIGRETLTKVVPVFVAVMVWIIRILIIGTFSMAGDRLFSMADARPSTRAAQTRFDGVNHTVNQSTNSNPRPFQKTQPLNAQQRPTRPEPTYQPLGMAAKSRDEDPGTWR